jgi:hypothetical protein
MEIKYNMISGGCQRDPDHICPAGIHSQTAGCTDAQHWIAVRVSFLVRVSHLLFPQTAAKHYAICTGTNVISEPPRDSGK